MYKYILIDKNNLIGNVYESSNLEKVMHQLLLIIKSHLQTIVSLNIKVSLESLKFDNYCVAKIKNKKRQNPMIVEVYNYSFKTGFTHNSNVMNISSDLLYTLDEIKETLKLIELPGPNVTPKSFQNEIIPNKVNFDKTNSAMRTINVPKQESNDTFSTNITKKTPEIDNNVEIIANKFNQDSTIVDAPKQFSLTKQKQSKVKPENTKKTKYEADKRAYYMMKEDIKTGKLSMDKMSVLFVEKYPIYEYLEEIGIIDNSDAYLEYDKLYEELYNDDETYESEYQPLDDILKQLDTDDPVIIRKQKGVEQNLIEELEDNIVESKSIGPMTDSIHRFKNDKSEIDIPNDISFDI